MNFSKIILVSAVGCILLLLSAFYSPSKQVHEYEKGLCDAPLIPGGYTGAPGNGTCGNSGCHTGTINSGPGSTIFQFDGGGTEYIPGQTYTIDISMEQSGINKFGFQVISYEDAGNTMSGTPVLTDAVNTRTINASGGKVYVGSTPCGSDAPVANSISWSYDWTAPPSDEGNITFYLCSIATNHNHSGSGDNVYTQTLTISPASTISIAEEESFNSIKLAPNPASNMVNLQLQTDGPGDVVIEVANALGQIVYSYEAGNQPEGMFVHSIQLGEDNAPGIYFVRVQTNNRLMTEQLVIN